MMSPWSTQVNGTSATDHAPSTHARTGDATRSRTVADLVRRVVRRYLDGNAPTWATSISWNALASFVPVVLLLVSLLGFLYGTQPQFVNAVITRIARLGAAGASSTEIRAAVEAFHQHTELFASIGGVWLLWSGSALFSAMEYALSTLYGVLPRSFVRRRLLAVMMTLVFALLLTPLVLSAALLTEGRRFSLLPSGTPYPLIVLVQFVAGAIVGTVIFLTFYHRLPSSIPKVRRVFFGACVAGTALELVTLLFPVWLHFFNGTASYGVLFSAIVLLVTYFYLVGQITVIGALINVERDPEMRVRRPRPLRDR